MPAAKNDEGAACVHCKKTVSTAKGPMRMLLCDGKAGTCENGAHMKCLNLERKPTGDWFCPSCATPGAKAKTPAKKAPAKAKTPAKAAAEKPKSSAKKAEKAQPTPKPAKKAAKPKPAAAAPADVKAWLATMGLSAEGLASASAYASSHSAVDLAYFRARAEKLSTVTSTRALGGEVIDALLALLGLSTHLDKVALCEGLASLASAKK